MAIITPLKKLFSWQYAHDTIEQLKVKILGYRSYKALLTQTGTDAPVATVLENNLGINITYAYDSVGSYFAYTSVPFFASPTETITGQTVEVIMTPSSSFNFLSGDDYVLAAYPVFFFIMQIATTQAGTLTDDVLGYSFSTVFEIRVYNK